MAQRFRRGPVLRAFAEPRAAPERPVAGGLTHPRPDATQVGWPALSRASPSFEAGVGPARDRGGWKRRRRRHGRRRHARHRDTECPSRTSGQCGHADGALPGGDQRGGNIRTLFPAIGPIGADGYLAAWCAAAGTTPRRRGVRAAIFGPDGTRRSAWFWAAGPVEGDESGGFRSVFSPPLRAPSSSRRSTMAPNAPSSGAPWPRTAASGNRFRRIPWPRMVSSTAASPSPRWDR